jgi:hypothetical protein
MFSGYVGVVGDGVKRPKNCREGEIIAFADRLTDGATAKTSRGWSLKISKV